MIIQSLITTKIMSIRKGIYYNEHNIKKQKVLCLHGYNSGKILEKAGANVIYYQFDSVDKLVDVYLDKQDIYIGVVLEYFDAVSQLGRNSNLVISNTSFGFTESCWIVKKTQKELLDDVNRELVRTTINLQKLLICKKYLKPENVYLCNI